MTLTLQPTAKTVLEALQALQAEGKVSAKVLSENLGMDYIMIMAAVNALKENGLGDFKEEVITEYQLTEEGLDYAKNKLPESRVFKYIIDHEIKQVNIKDLQVQVKKALGLDSKIFFLAINNLKKAMWISLTKMDNISQVIVLKQEYEDMEGQALLDLLHGKKLLTGDSVPENLKKFIKIFKKRKLVIEKTYTMRMISLTAKGKKLDISKVKSITEVTRLTRDMLADDKWRELSFKSYDVEIPGPIINAGKINPLVEIINKVREIFYSMGFREIRGPIVESAFFNFDALFQPQDHPAREMHDTFYLSKPKVAKLPAESIVKAVSAIHENGGDTGSTGWGYKWDRGVAKQTLLRTHTTTSTVRQLGKAIKDGATLPLKIFSVDRVFRNEKVDRSHLAEFMQVEGIIIGENLTLSDLRGTLMEFYRKMGFEKIITRPGFFPYTEPSMEISVFSKELDKWLEIGGSGIFRPEVCAPWGIKEPVRVLAWGQGLERIAMLRLGRKDIRDLYKNPLSWLRRAPYPKL
ncbi:MAG: phenylalanine--tRNA ligase subunit alpha [Promethearchaeota archaeon]